MPRPAKTTQAARSESKVFLAKAQEFLEAARSALSESRHDAAMLNSIHAAISAADAVSVALAGRRSTDPDHARAADLLEQAGGPSPEVRAKARQLRALLAKKNVVTYEARRSTPKEAADAFERADRIVEWAAETVRRARL